MLAQNPPAQQSIKVFQLMNIETEEARLKLQALAYQQRNNRFLTTAPFCSRDCRQTRKANR